MKVAKIVVVTYFSNIILPHVDFVDIYRAAKECIRIKQSEADVDVMVEKFEGISAKLDITQNELK